MKTTFRKLEDIIKDTSEESRCPFPLEIIPNKMGINLCSVDAISWQEQEDGQLTQLTIYFVPVSEALKKAGLYPENFPKK